MIQTYRAQESSSPLAGPSAVNIATNATTVVKTGAGILVGILINKPGASANTMVIYDNTAASGTKLASYDATAVTVGQVLDFGGCAFGTGLTVITATGTAVDCTVFYR